MTMTYIIGDIAYAAPSEFTAEIRDFLAEKTHEHIAMLKSKLAVKESVIADLTAKLSV